MPAFHNLLVSALDPLTTESIAITLAVPEDLRTAYEFRPGQHLTFRTHTEDGVEERRSYSICTTPASGRLQVAVKLLPGGRFSSFVHDQLAVGDTLTVMTPAGRFGQRRSSGDGSFCVAVAAGSGITPLMSIIATTLAQEPNSRYTLIYGNRTTQSVMFAEEIGDLKDRYPSRLQVIHVLSREDHQSPLLSGRIDKEKLDILLQMNPTDCVDDWFLCGPAGLVGQAQAELLGRGVGKRQIHTELFYTGDVAPLAHREAGTGANSLISARLDGRTSTFEMPDSGSLLDAILTQRADAPYACKGGVCGTCRVKVVDGEVEMARNFALDPQDLDSGFRLACQSVPISPHVAVDFDA